MSRRRKANRQRHGPAGHHYVPKVLALAAAVAERGPGAYHVDVRHDDWCMVWNGGACNCDPDVTLREPGGAR